MSTTETEPSPREPGKFSRILSGTLERLFVPIDGQPRRSRWDLVHPGGLTPFGWLLAVGILASLLLVGATGGLQAGNEYFTLAHVTADSESIRVSHMGSSFCRIDGVFGGATASMRTEIQLTLLEVDVSSAALVDAPAETDWVSIGLGLGPYWLDVVGGDGTTDLTLHCRSKTK